MEPTALVQGLGGTLFALLLGAILGIVAALVSGVLLLRGRRVPPVLAGCAVGIPGLVGLGAAGLAMRGVATDPEAALAAAVAYRLITVFFALPGAVFLALFAAVAGARSAPRRWWAFGVGLGLVVVTLAIGLVGGVVEEDLAYPLVRSAAYGLLGLLTAAAMLCGGEEDAAGPEAGVAAGVTFAMVVALGEASGRALEDLFLLAVMIEVPTEGRAAYVEHSFAEVLAPMAPYHWGTLAAACVLGLVAVAAGVRAGRLAVLSGLVWVVLAPVALWMSDPGP
ncbi:MAG: hypothetical protein JRI25_10905, partial [Deltaproteobacteria bacterium]|nr:hypothetical protein [Deltaproteobacteria bacterium]